MTAVTIILSTYNRAGDLRLTLDAFRALDSRGIDPEFIVVDNNSNDDTAEVIRSFHGVLPMRSMFHPEPGKNRALNAALNSVDLREIVVFTDDDVTPREDWLQEIARAAAERPDANVFGGKVEVAWPDGEPPRWATARWVQTFAFALHDLGDASRPYADGSYPFGPNMWVRSRVFEGGVRFDGRVGPQPTNRLMGSESTFLRDLAARGHRPVYWPAAVVRHRIQAKELNTQMVLRRAARFGKSQVHFSGLPDGTLAQRARARWLLRRVLGIARSRCVLARALFTRDESVRFSRRCAAARMYAAEREAIRLLFARPGGQVARA